MSQSNWTDAIVGERMTVDQEFSQRVHDSRFNNQEWGLIMTATEFEIENADDQEAARIVADTSNLQAIMPEVEKMRQNMGAMGGGPTEKRSGGFLSSVKDALGVGGGGDGVDPERVSAAEDLVQEYADALQAHLDEKGRWEQVRIAYQE